jgi:membrane-bound inhibitor of C-type lysozyme
MGRARSNSGPNDESGDIAVDAVGNAYITGNGGEFGGSVTTIKYGLCSIVCPQNIAVNNEPGKCEAVVNFSATTTGNCGDLVFLDGQDTVSSASSFAVGTHIILVKSPSTEETCSFTITVIDNEKPVITESPASLTVSCAADVPLPDIKLVKATDNCGDVTISHAGDVISDQTCANRFTLTRTYKATDSHGNTATCSQVITVNDIVPPRITDFSLSRESLFPPNHTMQDITLNYQVFDNCVSSPLLTVRVSSNEPVNGTGDGDTDPDWLVIDPHHVQLRAERSGIGNGRIYTITVTADDGCNPAVSVTKQVFVAHNITGPQTGNPFRIGSTVSLNGVFWDKPGNKHTAKWLLDGSVASNGTVVEPSGNQNGKVSGSYKFNSAGVYKMQMNVTDQSGVTSYANTNGDLEAIVVIYDPNGGNVYGGGWYNSPAGALAGNPLATGKASYGFAVNYKNAIKPQGETQFEFKSGSFEFNAVNFDYLAVNGATAQFKGTGKITGGQSGIGFIMTVSDGALDGSNVDKIRMKVYNRSTGVVIYDNQPGTNDAVLPATAVGTNSVIVIQGNNINASVVNNKQENLSEDKTMVDGLTVSAYPNPTKNYFTISVNSNNKEEIMLQVFDQDGRTMDVRRNVIPGSVIRFGDKYTSGAYYVRIMQGKEHKEIKLIKVPD